MNSTWPLARLLMQSALHVEVVQTASYLALAGVIALLLCLLLLATINTCLICRNPSGKRPSPYIESMTDVPRAAGQCSPYHMTHLHAHRDGSAKPARKSSGSGGYAKPFHPGRGVSLSKHYVTVDIEPTNGLGSAPMTDACHQCSTWYDTDIVVLRSPQNSCLTDNGRFSLEYVMDLTYLATCTSAVVLVGVALIVFLLLKRFHRLIQATLRIELSRFLQSDNRHNETTQTSRVKPGGALRTYPLTPGMCTGCLAGGGYIRMDTDNMSNTSHEENVTYNEYGCTSVTV